MGPAHEAVPADSLGPVPGVVLGMPAPAERPAFVLHDMFAVPSDEIAPIVGRTPDAARIVEIDLDASPARAWHGR